MQPRFSKSWPHCTNSFPHFDITKTREFIITTCPRFRKTRELIIIS